MDYLSDLLFFMVQSQLNNKTLPKDLAYWLPNALFSNHKDQLAYLVLFTPDTSATSELKSLIAKADALYSFEDITQWHNIFDAFIEKHGIDLAACEKKYHFRAASYAAESYRYCALQSVVFKIECFLLR